MMKYTKSWIIFSLSLWLICCQGLFVLVQSSLGQKIVESTQGQIRQELDFSNFNFLARSITDYTTSGSIKCAVLEKVWPEHVQILDLRYMNDHCQVSAWQLKGVAFNETLKTLNGDNYQFQFISNNPFFFELALWGFRVLGILAIVGIILSMKFLAERRLMMIESEIELADKVRKIALQVSHDIRSPLTALKMAVDEANLSIPNESRKIIHGSVQRINDIANNLLSENNDRKNKSDNILTTELLAVHVDLLVSEKRMQYRHQTNIDIESDLSLSYGLFVNINPVELKRVLSNLINNAVEAIEHEGKIIIQVALADNDKILLSIKDNGKGIPADILAQLGNKGLSHGKDGKISGHGLGLYHAKETIAAFLGVMEIESDLGSGTTFRIYIPRAVPPQWFTAEILLTDNKSVFILDDEKSMLDSWSEHLIRPLHLFTRAEDFKKAIIERSTEDFVALVDFDLYDQSENGIDVIKSLNIEAQSILVTSHFEDQNIISELKNNNIKMIPKMFFSLVPIKLITNTNSEFYDYVYIEDEKLLRISWERKAKRLNINLLVIASPRDFAQYSGQISKEFTHIYIDALLGENEMSGTDFAGILHLEGYQHLAIASGLEAENFEHRPWLKYTGKSPPF